MNLGQLHVNPRCSLVRHTHICSLSSPPYYFNCCYWLFRSEGGHKYCHYCFSQLLFLVSRAETALSGSLPEFCVDFCISLYLNFFICSSRRLFIDHLFLVLCLVICSTSSFQLMPFKSFSYFIKFSFEINQFNQLVVFHTRATVSGWNTNNFIEVMGLYWLKTLLFYVYRTLNMEHNHQMVQTQPRPYQRNAKKPFWLEYGAALIKSLLTLSIF